MADEDRISEEHIETIFCLSEEEMEHIELLIARHPEVMDRDTMEKLFADAFAGHRMVIGLPLTPTLHGTAMIEKLWGFYRRIDFNLVIRLVAEQCQNLTDEQVEIIRQDVMTRFVRMLDSEIERFRKEVNERIKQGPAANPFN